MSTNLLSNTTSLQQILELLDKKAAGGGTNTEDATATAESILQGETAYIATGKVTGTMPNNGTLELTMDGIDNTAVTIPEGYTEGGTVSLDDTISNEVDEQSDLITQLIDKANTLPNINDTGETETEIINSIINKTIVEYGNSTLTVVGSSAFAYQPSLIHISFPNCTRISGYAFYSCSCLQEISFSKCTLMENYAFAYCKNLISANFSLCTTLGSYAFVGCSKLLAVSMPACTNLGSDAFYGCSQLQTAYFPTCRTINDYAFCSCSQLSQIILSDCERIYGSVFRECYNLSYLQAPQCSWIGSYACSDCSALSSVELPCCIRIWDNAFYSCPTITSLNLSACQYISQYAFAKCENLHTAILGPNYTSSSTALQIGSGAFQQCTKLTNLTLRWESIVTLVNSNAFNSTPLAVSSYEAGIGSIYVLPSLVERYKVANYWSFYADRITAIIDE